MKCKITHIHSVEVRVAAVVIKYWTPSVVSVCPSLTLKQRHSVFFGMKNQSGGNSLRNMPPPSVMNDPYPPPHPLDPSPSTPPHPTLALQLHVKKHASSQPTRSLPLTPNPTPPARYSYMLRKTPPPTPPPLPEPPPTHTPCLIPPPTSLSLSPWAELGAKQV